MAEATMVHRARRRARQRQSHHLHGRQYQRFAHSGPARGTQMTRRSFTAAATFVLLAFFFVLAGSVAAPAPERKSNETKPRKFRERARKMMENLPATPDLPP